jgi:GNAT superfamily N-acetyltransferase
LTKAARPLIEEAMAHLSPETSRRRFFTVRYRLSDQELDALTDFDGFDRFALGASVIGPDGRSEGVGIARFVRVANAPDTAEVAVLVVDAYQGQGVGKTLLARLAAAAVARGIGHFRGIVLPDNDPMLGLVRKHAPAVAMVSTDGHLSVDAPLTPRFGAATH